MIYLFDRLTVYIKKSFSDRMLHAFLSFMVFNFCNNIPSKKEKFQNNLLPILVRKKSTAYEYLEVVR